MKLEITRDELLSPVKTVTSASVDDWSNAFKRLVVGMAPVIAFTWTLVLSIKDIARSPKKTLAAYYRDLTQWLVAANTADADKHDSDVRTANSVTKKSTSTRTTDSAPKIITAKRTTKSGVSTPKARTTRKRSTKASSATASTTTTV